jgi:hypothetical protein
MITVEYYITKHVVRSSQKANVQGLVWVWESEGKIRRQKNTQWGDLWFVFFISCNYDGDYFYMYEGREKCLQIFYSEVLREVPARG